MCHMRGLYDYWGYQGKGVDDGLCKKCKGLPHPSAQFSLIVVWPYHLAPLFHASFSQRFHFCHYCFSTILQSIGSHILDAVYIEVKWVVISGLPLLLCIAAAIGENDKSAKIFLAQHRPRGSNCKSPLSLVLALHSMALHLAPTQNK